jgi:uracil-DNA glycosylase
MHTVIIEPSYESWRDAARRLLAARIQPAAVLWSDDHQETNLFAEPANPFSLPETTAKTPVPRVSSAFLEMAETAAAHTDPRRWGMLYQLLWRSTHGGEKHLLQLMTDPQLRIVQNWCKAVRREIHKMHAFVRFRLVGVDEISGRERFLAWFEPEYRIVKMATPFFVKRFASMDWSILTPYACAHWDGKHLHFSAGVAKDQAPAEDAHDDLWRTYYKSIFNPARLKVKAMTTEMPKRYWKNLPEAAIIDELVASSSERMQRMMETEHLPAKPAPRNAYLKHLQELNEAENAEDSP